MDRPSEPDSLPTPIREPWLLRPNVRYLNHGSFGARLATVQAAQDRWRQEMESQPCEFHDRRLGDLLGDARERVGRHLGMHPDDFGFVSNASEGTHAVLRSIGLQPDDEVVVTDHGYGAVARTMEYLASTLGVRTQVARIPIPVASTDEAARCILDVISPATRLLIVDHITSPSALVLPVEAIVAECNALGVDVLIDGAHAPGMLDLDVASIGAAFYTGNLHKWICAPPGAAFVWAREDRRAELHPVVISHFLGEGLAREFAWQGTRDPTAWLAAADAIDRMPEVAGSWPAVRAHNQRLARDVQDLLACAWQTRPAGPADGSMTGAMTALLVPDELRGAYAEPAAMQAALAAAGFEIPVTNIGDTWFIRASCQIYNAREEYEALAQHVRSLLTR